VGALLDLNPATLRNWSKEAGRAADACADE
jgi:hypothetical protein